MNYSDFYYDFFEGTLDISKDQEFLELLRTDESFRLGMKGFVNVTRTIDNNIKLLGPSIQETGEIYSKLGFTIPAVIETLPAAAMVGGSFFQNSIFKYLLTGVTSALITLLTFYFLWDAKDTNGGSPSFRPEKIIEKSTQIPQVSNLEKFVKNESGNSPSQKFSKVIPIVLNNQEKKINLAQNNEQNINVSNFNSELINNNLNSILPRNSNQFEKLNFNTQLEILDFSNLISQKTGLSLEIRNSLNWNLPGETISPYLISKFNGLGISLIYDLSDIFKIGLDVRQETFFAQYSTRTTNEIINYEQQPNLTSYGILFNYTPEMEILNFRPDLLINFSGNYYGLICRGGAGLEYSFGNNLFGTLRAEYSKMFFKHDLNWFQANKVGIYYGIKLKF